jgi:restriction system protein
LWAWVPNQKSQTRSQKLESLKSKADRGITRFRAEKKISDIVSAHLDELSNRRDTLVRVGRYGVVDCSDWNREVQHFADNVVRPQLNDDEAQSLAGSGFTSVFQKLVEMRVAEHSATRLISAAVPGKVSPLEFEGICAAVLRQTGWSASTTKGSGDQGADVVAEYKGKKLVVQCKFYTGNVGNKAVQEVLAAKQFYSADIAAVVCKSDYTRSAKQLANVAGVEILTYSELAAFSGRLVAKIEATIR